MTTEIAVLNRLGIALATDSAVTVGAGSQTKVFDTADKLFELSPLHPVAIMINGSMDCVGVPWEIIIKDFREQLGRSERGTIAEWMGDFLSFIESYPALNKNIARRHLEYMISEMASGIKKYTSDRLLQVLLSGRRRSDEDVTVIVRNSILTYLSEIQPEYDRLDVAGSLVSLPPDAIAAEYGSTIDPILDDVFQPHTLSDEERAELRALVLKRMVAAELSDFTTGLVVAGYGSNSTFPAVSTVLVDGLVLGTLKHWNVESQSVVEGAAPARVVSFAQTDVIERLLGGADPQFVEQTAEFIRKAIADVGARIEEVYRPPRMSQKRITDRERLLSSIADVVAGEYANDTAPELSKRFRTDFERMISVMPKKELIDLAESLVGITAVERKASSDQGTVGGAIDVAMITKHEGFVWIKRKHYFEGHLNPRYFWRRYGPVSARGENAEDTLRAQRSAARPANGDATGRSSR